MHLSVGLESISSYKRLSYNIWYALAEFVDNSTQSYRDNKEALSKSYESTGSHLVVSILYDKEKRIITIRDNSIGMSAKELSDALLIAAHPPKNGGRSKYGMGLKTAACWLGDRWSIKTKKLGATESVRVTIDVPAIAQSGNGSLEPQLHPSDPLEHYTEITIGNLHRRFSAKTNARIIEHLRSIYRRDLAEGTLQLVVQGEALSWTGLGKPFLKDDNGKEYRQDIEIDIKGKKVTGWIGILESGGRKYGGFSLLQNDRVIRGYPTAWKPSAIFGQEEGSNDLVNQRLCGELNVDGFEVSHTKDDISWQDDELELLEKELAEKCDIYRRVAKEHRKKGDRRGTSSIVINDALSKLLNELSSDALVDTIDLVEAPPETVLNDVSKQSIAQASKTKPRIDVNVGDLRVKVYIDYDARAESPYYTLVLGAVDKTASVAINPNHPYMIELADSAFPDYLRQCVYDAIAEYKTVLKRGKVEPNTVRFYKDNLLRVPYKIYDEASEPETLSDETEAQENEEGE